ncbi:hypothetical protein GPJ56_006745 [Histomonas meleagridis]|uniref:uncharacterized protein n=1 Tax=Histomonas meleagridis TaxID=135588 RepID=UPI0035597357|nr:hypothetical protein GPJ56_006745 [Histomonas meleagridis]KAH0806959.1 hypothetical protein GO595_000135 [Histomonas meleagridis]
MEEEKLVEWLNNKVNGNLRTIEEASSGREICYYLILITGKAAEAANVTRGRVPFEKSTNFQLAKQIYGSELNLPFDFNMGKLVSGDKGELSRIISSLISLDPEKCEDQEMSIDDLLDNLEKILNYKLKELKQFRSELDSVSEERNFYFDKLTRIEALTKQYPPNDVHSVTQLLELPPEDFKPCK